MPLGCARLAPSFTFIISRNHKNTCFGRYMQAFSAFMAATIALFACFAVVYRMASVRRLLNPLSGRCVCVSWDINHVYYRLWNISDRDNGGQCQP